MRKEIETHMIRVLVLCDKENYEKRQINRAVNLIDRFMRLSRN